MRMWMINPKFLCKKHLLGEHGEIHKHLHNFQKHHRMTGRIFPIVLIEPASMQQRHDELAKEMLSRGYNHKSPYVQPDISHLPENEQNAKVDMAYNIVDLTSRCFDCKKLFDENLGGL